MLSSTISIRLVTASFLLSVLGAWGGDARSQDPYEDARQEMVESQLRRRGIRQQSLLNAMETVPLHLCGAEAARPEAYVD